MANIPRCCEDAQVAEKRVEFLCTRFSALFAQLHQEEHDLRTAENRNRDLERRLDELRQKEWEEQRLGKAEVDGRMTEEAELRREVEAAERRLALGGGEMDALVKSATAYARQAERLHERCEEEAAREHDASVAYRRRAEELSELRQHRLELSAELEGAEAGKAKVKEEFQLVSQRTAQMCQEITMLERRVQEELQKGEASEAEVNRKREQLHELDDKLKRSNKDLENLAHRLEGERCEGRSRGEQMSAHTERRMRCEAELRSLSLQLEERRRDGHEAQLRLAEQTKQIQQLRERLKAEQGHQRQEQYACETAHAKLTQLRAELPSAEKALQVAETELLDVRSRCMELEERCAAHRSWRDEIRQKAQAGEAALIRLRDELRILTTDRSRLQKELDQVTADKTRLEVEIEVALPAVQDVRRRCRDLERHLGERVRELGDEAEKARRYRAEAISAHERLQVLEHHRDVLCARVKEQKAHERQRAERFEQVDAKSLCEPRQVCPYAFGSAAVGRGDGEWPNADVVSKPRRPPSPAAIHPVLPDLPTSLGSMGHAGYPSNDLFDRIDANRDGVIDRQELGNALQSREILQAYSPTAAATAAAAAAGAAAGIAASTAASWDSINSALLAATAPGARSNAAVPRLGEMEAVAQAAPDAVRFLCDFVAREEERLGLNASRGTPHATPGPATPRTPGNAAPFPSALTMSRFST